MYQFYYARKSEKGKAEYRRSVSELIDITAIRPQMWEEHCLECSAPLCYETCPHFIARADGRCMRFVNSFEVNQEEKGCCGQSARVKFRKWANMMTIIFPAMLSVEDIVKLTNKNQTLGKGLHFIVNSPLPKLLKWQGIRTIEYVRRRSLKHLEETNNTADAFVFHGFSYQDVSYRLILEIYDSHTPVFKKSFWIEPGENLIFLPASELSDACNTAGYLVKIYPENDIEADIDILWCDFVKGDIKDLQEPAPKVKCVVWDLDNTLWNGTLIETNSTDQLALNSGVKEIVEELDARGIIQSVASKNDFESAWKVIENLGLQEYFLYPQIHWNAKSGSMRQIAKSLNIGIDSLALIDDSIFEREQVKSTCPSVRTYDIADLQGLLERTEFCVPVTEESRNRRKMYMSEAKRNEMMQEDNTDTVEFIRKCNLGINIFIPKSSAEIERCFELTVRTNQLNMSGNKYNREAFEVVLRAEGTKNFAFICSDDFGAYGIVGFGQYRVQNNRLIFSEFAMSCRVAGKYVESALFTALLEKEKVEEGEFHVKKTKKNVLLRNTLQDIGFETEFETDSEVQFLFGSNLLHKDLVKAEYKEQ